jgi:AmiR/NasT family two-component response regulator
MGKPELPEYETVIVDRQRIRKAKEILMEAR